MNIHELDQVMAALGDMAKLTKKYYDELIKEGFKQKEALSIVATWSASLLNGGK